MRTLSRALPILPLCGLVAFPHTPLLLVTTKMPLEEPTIVGLLHSPNNGQLANVGTLARALPTEGSMVLECDTFGRFRFDDCDNHELLSDTAHSDASEGEQRMAEVWESLTALATLANSSLPAHLEALRAADCSSFSLALAGSMDLEHKLAQELLALTCPIDRLNRLHEVIDKGLAMERAHAALRSLGGMGL